MEETCVNVGKYIAEFKTQLTDNQIMLFGWEATNEDQGRYDRNTTIYFWLKANSNLFDTTKGLGEGAPYPGKATIIDQWAQFRSPCIKPTEKTFGNNSSSLSHVVGSAGIPKDVFDSKNGMELLGP